MAKSHVDHDVTDHAPGNAVKDLEAGKTEAPSRNRSRETSGLHQKRPNSHESCYMNPSRRCAPGLLIIGASVRAAAQSAIQAGYRVVAADLFADRDLRGSAESIQVRRYPDDFAAVRASFPLRPMVYTGALENYPDLLDQLASGGPILGNGGDVVRRVRDPFRLEETLKQEGILLPTVRRRPPPSDQAGQWLVKPLRSAGGQRVQFWRTKMPPAGDGNGDYIFQQFVPGTVCSASFLATRGDCRLLGMTEMLVGCDWAGAAGFTYCGSIQRHPPSVECSQWNRIGRAIAREFSLIGLFGVDGVVAQGQIWPIEVNPRYTASMELLEHALGISLIGLHVDACHGRPFPRTPARVMDRRLVGKSILFAPHDLQLHTRFGDLATSNRLHVKLADVPEPNGIVRRGQPILTLIVTADSRDQVVKGLRVSSTELMTRTTGVG